jgi:hypothetical protein
MKSLVHSFWKIKGKNHLFGMTKKQNKKNILTIFCAKLIRNKVGTLSPQKRVFHTNKNLKRFHSKLANKILNIYWLRSQYGHMNLKSVLNNNCTASRTVLTRKFQKLIRPNCFDAYLHFLIVKVLQTVQGCSMTPRKSVQSMYSILWTVFREQLTVYSVQCSVQSRPVCTPGKPDTRQPVLH